MTIWFIEWRERILQMSEDKQKRKRAARGEFLPVSREDMMARGWGELDFLVISGDAYVDHPSFGHAIISRCLEAFGYRVGVLAQPNWRSSEDFIKMGRPRLGVMVSAGNLDSMLSHYTASGKKRRGDKYTPGGRAAMRPDRATIVYCNKVREIWRDVPLIIGGIEASLRRFAHYDYWSDSVRRSVLADSRADLLVFGMGELAVSNIARLLENGMPVGAIRNVDGTCWKTHAADNAKDAVRLPSYDEVSSDKRRYAEAFKLYYLEQDVVRGRRLMQDQGAWLVVQNKPARPLTEKEMDKVYSYPYTRVWHPDYDKFGGVPALDEVSFSIVSHRGCFGECSFCAISSHQGRVVQRRSDDSIMAEAEGLKMQPDFKGYIHDVGGPTANFLTPSCDRQKGRGMCAGKSCLYPEPCENLRADHSEYLTILRKLRNMPGVKKVFIRSGIRYDYMMADKSAAFLEELCRYHISGQLKIAPEHVSENVLRYMKKAPKEITTKFLAAYRDMNKKLGLDQYVVPYFMSAHPGSTLSAALELAEYIRDSGLRPEQVQDFTPTPGSMSTCMYYTELDPMTGEKIYVPKGGEERKMQRALLQYWQPENAEYVRAALIKLGREDLIGDTSKCLVSGKKRILRKAKSTMDKSHKWR